MLKNQQYPAISVIIPAHNEAENLQHVLPHIPSMVSEAILVDGQSTDDTIAVAQQLLPTIQAIKQVGKGKGDALRVGFAACTGDIIVTLDADGSTDPREIPCFVGALLAGNDFAKGSRFIQGGGSLDITFLRRLGNYGLCKLVNLLFGAGFKDLCYGYNAFWKYCLDYIEIDCDGFEIETLISLRIHKSKLKIIEVPSFEHRRIWGQSNLHTFRDGWRVLKTIIRERGKNVSPRTQPRHLSNTISTRKVASVMKGAVLDVSVIICTYAEERWHLLVAAVESIQRQSTPPHEIIVVVDHNLALLERVQMHIPGVLAIENSETRGLSGARNSGIAVAGEALIAFLDDDAIAEPDWLGWLSQCCADHQVLGAGGAVEPLWMSKRPGWFPEEFYWVVGCSYRGLPEARAVVRNPYGCCTCYRREVFEVAGGFRNEIGRVGSRPLGCEETELCVRAKQHWPQQVFLCEPRARIHHCISTSRASWHYFRSRCYAEGLSKAIVAQYVGTKDGLASERTYTLRTLPKGVLRGLMDGLFRFDPAGFLRAGAIIAGLIITTAGYLVGSISRPLVLSKGASTSTHSHFKQSQHSHN